ncbi:MAG: hypothetical protein OXF78_01540, partial [Rhodospirillales bacterium]|nr:hypothetical protein [Rhodospirillales bacterium]
ALSRIYDTIRPSPFNNFLRRNNLLSKYMVTVSYIHYCQLAALMITTIGLIALFVSCSELWNRMFLGAVVAVSGYAIYQVSTAVEIMNDLLWQKGIFDDHIQKQ